MLYFVESQRLLLEEIDTIEAAIAQRIRRNVDIVPETELLPNDILSGSSKKRPYKETLLQAHEVKYLIDEFKNKCQSIKESKKTKQGVFMDELSILKDPMNNFTTFDLKLSEIKARYDENEQILYEGLENAYAMYSSAPKYDERETRKKKTVKRKHILSEAAAHINLDRIFTNEEFYGKYLDLNEFYGIFKNIFKQDMTYVEYLSTYDKVPYTYTEMNTKSYVDYLRKLAEYLESFIRRAQPLFNISKLLEDIGKDQPTTTVKFPEDGEANVHQHYCNACQKNFTNESVYKSHLNGKKHKKNEINAKLRSEVGGEYKKSKADELKLLESKIRKLGEFLDPVRSSTISNAERKYALTERERLQEIFSLAGEESEYTTASDSSKALDDDNTSSDDEENSKNLPIGVDGRPIPFWLYKLQGLHQTYTCEICGDISYKGRSLFSKHFGGVKHHHGLKCLGIPDDYMPLFKGVVKINEATDLWRRLKKEKRIKEGDKENAVEFEDEEGNVMSEKDYIDLKKQGLL
ncbi:uncharacterized protein PRCAT00006023001 [Priceomyces carsonii]|uniref:uncharacterized protein n=1 Tax=Priceomyces carsonii TaxID=28549 RepID=UPI002ED9ADA4|nr:unnamed protein product [Priceomyces carsonii]